MSRWKTRFSNQLGLRYKYKSVKRASFPNKKAKTLLRFVSPLLPAQNADTIPGDGQPYFNHEHESIVLRIVEQEVRKRLNIG